MKRFMVVVALVGCSKAEPTSSPDDRFGVAPAPELGVELAGVTLAEDCGDGVHTKPLAPPAQPAPKAAATAVAPPAAEMVAAGACATPGGCAGPPPPACEQTAMQLSLKMPESATASTIKIKSVELLDTSGKTLATLTARAASKWDGKGTYVAWDEAVPAGKANHVVSYKLTAPDWAKLTDGRWNAHSKRFNLRVTVTINNRDKTIEKQSIQPAMPEPAVAT